MAGYTIPNEANAASGDQSEIDSGDIQILTTGISGSGVISGCAVTANGPANNRYAVATGIVRIGKIIANVTAAPTPIIAADATNAKYVLIEIDTSGTISNNVGTAAPKPVFPIPSVNKIVIAAGRIAPTSGSVTLDSTTIIDKRVFVSAGNKNHVYATDYGLGDGVTSDYTAITNAIAAASAAFTQPGLNRSSNGVTLELPAGTYTLTPPAAPTYGSVLPVIGPTNTNNGGAIWIVGQGSGSTTLTVPNTLGHSLPLTSSTRGTNGGANFAGNTFTLGFASAHNAVVGQIIAIRIMSRGRAMWAHYTIINVPDSTHVQYMAGAVEDGTGHTPLGGNLDTMIPPVTLIPAPYQGSITNIVYFLEYLIEPLNFKQPHTMYLDKLTLQSGSNTNTPLDGMGLRISSRLKVMADCMVQNFWIGGVYNGTPHIHPSLPSIAQVPQNTDHNWMNSTGFTNNVYAQLAFIDNDSESYFRKKNQPGLGGGRDNHINNANFGQSGVATWVCSDSGNLETLDINGTNMKGGSYPILCEGVDGVESISTEAIDCMTGWMKIEGPGSYSFLMDETKRRLIVKGLDVDIRMESCNDINGADQGTPGGAGSVATGSFADYTDKPWTATNVSLSINTGMPTLNATVPAAMFGVDGGCDIGSILVLGLAFRSDAMGAPYATDGVTVVGNGVKNWQGAWSSSQAYVVGDGVSLSGTKYVCILGNTNQTPPNITYWSTSIAKFQSATAAFTIDDTSLRIDSTNLHGGSDTISLVNSATEVYMATAITTGSTAQAWLVKNDGTASQSGVCHEGHVATVTAPSGGFVNITMPYPIWAGTALPGPYNAQAGFLGHIRAGELHSWEASYIIDTEALDRMTRSSGFIDVKTLTTGSITLVQDDSGAATRRSLPVFRVSDAVVRSSPANDGAISGTTFTSLSAKFTALDVGRTITATGLNAGAGNDTISIVNSATSVTMTHSGTTGTTLAWTIGAQKNIVPFRFAVRRGQNCFYVYKHASGDANPILKGGYCEFSSSASGNQDIMTSTAAKTRLGAGVAMRGSLVGALPGVSTNIGSPFIGTTVGNTSARTYYDGSTLLIAQYPTVLSLNDDSNQLIASGTIGSGVLLVDVGDGTGQVSAWDGTTTGKRIVGQSIGSATVGTAVAAVLCVPYWT